MTKDKDLDVLRHATEQRARERMGLYIDEMRQAVERLEAHNAVGKVMEVDLRTVIASWSDIAGMWLKAFADDPPVDGVVTRSAAVDPLGALWESCPQRLSVYTMQEIDLDDDDVLLAVMRTILAHPEGREATKELIGNAIGEFSAIDDSIEFDANHVAEDEAVANEGFQKLAMRMHAALCRRAELMGNDRSEVKEGS